MKIWTKESAERIIKNQIGKTHAIILDGTMTLGMLSAADYLVKHHGYWYNVQK
jgi:hypothetical protein